MVTKSDAEKIIVLYNERRDLQARLKEIELMRTHGTSIQIFFKHRDPKPGYYTELNGLKYTTTYPSGKLDDLSETVLARLSDRVGHRLRIVEGALRMLGAEL